MLKWTLALCLIISFPSLAVEELLELNSPEGLKRLVETPYRADFKKLSTFFQVQTDDASCAVSSGVIVLNALRWRTDRAPWIEVPADLLKYATSEKRFRGYTTDNFFRPGVKSRADVFGATFAKNEMSGVMERDWGMQLGQLADALSIGHGLNVEKKVIGTMETSGKQAAVNDVDETRKDLMYNFDSNREHADEDFVIVNFARQFVPAYADKKLKGGHVTVASAFHHGAIDSVLVLDVNPLKSAWVWIPLQTLVNAMNSFDMHENRGYLLISEGKSKK